MEQPNEQPIESVQSSKNIWIIVVAITITALIVGGGVYAWQKSNLKSTEQSLQGQISVLQNQINQFQQGQADQNLPSVNQEQQPDETITQPETEQKSQDKQTYIENGIVYYVNERGAKFDIAQSIDNPTDPFKNITYERTELSPNKQFILLGSKGQDLLFIIEIYDILSAQIHDAIAITGYDYGEWLSDSRLRVNATCGISAYCGIYESIDNQTPWNLEKIANYDY
ncbi:MAG: hypothetical protein ABIF17_04900 [Patescibacteria group bacterium]